MRTLLVLVSALALSTLLASAQAPLPTTLMPVPAKLQMGSGQLAVDQLFTVAVEGAKDTRLENGVSRFLAELSRETGMPLMKKPAEAAKATLVIRCDKDARKVQELGEDESYTLEITATRANLTAVNVLGALHGLQTFLQLVQQAPTGFVVPV